MSALVQKICSICGTNVSQLKRTKDERGNYFCVPCWQARVRAVANEDDHYQRKPQPALPALSPGTSPNLEPDDDLPELPVAASAAMAPKPKPPLTPSGNPSNPSPIGKPEDSRKWLRIIVAPVWVVLILIITVVMGILQIDVMLPITSIFLLGLGCLGLDWWICNRVPRSTSRSLKIPKSARDWLSLGLYVFALLLGDIGLVWGGDLLVYVKEQRELGAAAFLFLVPIFALYLMPFIILWTLVKSATVIAGSKNSILKAIVAAAALAAIATGIAGYSRYRGMTSLLGSKPSDTSFVDFDSQFGAGIIGNPSLLSKTGEQAQESLKQYIGKMVGWKGVVLDVRDGQVLIQHRSFMDTNEVALILGWWDEPSLKLLNKGDVVEYTGVISGVGDPYPYTLTSGTIKSHHTASDDEQSQLLKDNDKAVLDKMYQK
jgi:hypothetical protein